MKPEPPSRAVVEFEKRRQVVVSWLRSEKPLLWPTKRKVAVFAANLFRLRDSSCINISGPRATDSVSMKLLQPSKRQRMLKNLASVSLPTTQKKEEDVLGVTDAADSMDFVRRGKASDKGVM